ncbi:WD repeat and HMG-box DNA-binding protein 1 [Dorcoceras hygrometricum]|uniref:WD repeat and HMG-box DNA-binding protein 1 n=1 Tax=Dorcoceras hygrometricum TaxID=472368 RepID=A0A2Z7CJY2_9LAMI|nr:WD repeat and HMG-box DNA-binding protein 1 [Dorcoceras hygrometricum]
MLSLFKGFTDDTNFLIWLTRSPRIVTKLPRIVGDLFEDHGEYLARPRSPPRYAPPSPSINTSVRLLVTVKGDKGNTMTSNSSKHQNNPKDSSLGANDQVKANTNPIQDDSASKSGVAVQDTGNLLHKKQDVDRQKFSELISCMEWEPHGNALAVIDVMGKYGVWESAVPSLVKSPTEDIPDLHSKNGNGFLLFEGEDNPSASGSLSDLNENSLGESLPKCRKRLREQGKNNDEGKEYSDGMSRKPSSALAAKPDQLGNLSPVPHWQHKPDQLGTLNTSFLSRALPDLGIGGASPDSPPAPSDLCLWLQVTKRRTFPLSVTGDRRDTRVPRALSPDVVVALRLGKIWLHHFPFMFLCPQSVRLSHSSCDFRSFTLFS